MSSPSRLGSAKQASYSPGGVAEERERLGAGDAKHIQRRLLGELRELWHLRVAQAPDVVARVGDRR